jgi:hypothetical protein
MIKLLSYIVWSLCLCLLVLFLSNTANAAAPTYHWVGGGTDFGGQKFSSPDAVCTALIAAYNSANPPPKSQAYCRPPHSDAWVNYYRPGTGNTDYRVYKTAGCVDGSKPDTSKALALQCPDTPPPENCPKMDQTETTTWAIYKGNTAIYDPRKGARNTANCNLEIIEVLRCYDIPNGANPDTTYCSYKTRQSGGVSNSGPHPNAGEEDKPKERTDQPPMPGNDDGSCPRGTVNAGLSASGIPMCIGQGTDPKNTPAAPPKTEVEKNEPTADGGTKNTKTETVTNADGSTTKTTTVTITGPGGEKSTTQDKTTGNSSSGAPGKETKPEDKSDLCKQNPNLAICKNSTVGGKCGETTCTGDAIQCATLRSVAVLQCKAEKDEEALKTSGLAAKGQAAIDGKDLEGLPGPKNGTFVSVPGMKAEGWLGNGAAFEDVSFSLQGHEVVMPLSKWSSYLLPLRYVMMIIASLISYRILAGAVLKE